MAKKTKIYATPVIVERERVKPNKLFYGDNLEVLRKYIKDESIDLCYIDPPFNSKRNYNQIYNRIGKEDKAQAQAFIDTWEWDDEAIQGYNEILKNEKNRFTIQTIFLIEGLAKVLGKDSLLAYLIHITLRATEIQRVLKPTGSFYLHCDPTASHYIKLVLDSVFCPKGGDYRNELIWHYRRYTGVSRDFQTMHDIIFRYSKTNNFTFNTLFQPYQETNLKNHPWEYDDEGKKFYWKKGKNITPYKVYFNEDGTKMNDVWIIPQISPIGKERLGYPTQKPEKLLEQIINASSNKGDLILDAYCGCGTSVAVAERLNRNWIGIDITYQSVSLILKRLTDTYSNKIMGSIELHGVPEDYESAIALANKEEDKVRKEFEKWAILFYTNNGAMINEKRGGDKGIDGVALIADKVKADIENMKIIFSVKSDLHPKPAYVRELKGRLTDEDVVMGVLICLYPPTKEMIKEAKETGIYKNQLNGMEFPKLKIVYVKDFFDKNERFIAPIHRTIKSAKIKEDTRVQINMFEKDNQEKLDLE
jgi:site-specific DNA-methyltransferase (adenine-specific)